MKMNFNSFRDSSTARYEIFNEFFFYPESFSLKASWFRFLFDNYKYDIENPNGISIRQFVDVTILLFVNSNNCNEEK